MSDTHWMQGDSSAMMRLLPDESVDLVLTSPPFLALRSYLPDDHPSKTLEMGSEPDPAAFIDALLAWTAECGRVLADHGSLCVELGDTYSGSGNGPDKMKDGHVGSHDLSKDPNVPKRGGEGWPLAKSLALIPEAYRMSLAYGRNILTGQPSPAGRWRIRNVIRWVRPNPPVGALGDKFRPATSEMVIACRSDRRWFDLDAVRTPHADHTLKYDSGQDHYASQDTHSRNDDGKGITNGGNPAGAPPLDWWKISTEPYAGSHYATWPRQLCVIPIKAMCPLERCTQCGTPRRRITGEAQYVGAKSGKTYEPDRWTSGITDGLSAHSHKPPDEGARRLPTADLGWTDCDCTTPDYQPGTVLDPFAGSGTTLAVATGHGRNAIGIDIDERNVDLARDRIGPMFFSFTDTGELPPWLGGQR